MSYQEKELRRSKDYGFLVAIRKSINSNCKALGIAKEDFAKEIGTTWNTLDAKLKPKNTKNYLTDAELIHILELTGDLYPLKYLCGMFEQIMTSTEPKEKVELESLGDSADNMVMECGEGFTSVKMLIKQGHASEDDVAASIKEIDETIEAAMKLKNKVQNIEITKED